MRVEDVPSALRRQLGLEATDGLLGTLDAAQREWTEDAVTRMVDRFERRLIQDVSGLRVELGQALATQSADLREALASQSADLREALAAQRAEFREQLADHNGGFQAALSSQRAEFLGALAGQGAEVRTAIAGQGAALRSEIATSRTDIIRWLFIFWTGQLIALAALLNALE
jgi:hypothetical protein